MGGRGEGGRRRRGDRSEEGRRGEEIDCKGRRWIGKERRRIEDGSEEEEKIR